MQSPIQSLPSLSHRFAHGFDGRLFLLGLGCALFDYFIQPTIFEPYLPEFVSFVLFLMPLVWVLACLARLVWLILRPQENASRIGSFLFTSLGFAILSLFVTILFALDFSTFIKAQTIDHQTFYTFDISFLDPDCLIKYQDGLYLIPLRSIHIPCNELSEDFFRSQIPLIAEHD